MNHIYLTRLVVLKRPGFQSQKYGMLVKHEVTLAKNFLRKESKLPTAYR